LQEKLKNSGISNVTETSQQEVAKDTLKEKIKEQVPDANDANINKIKGNISEKLMDWYFQNTGWEKLEGEVGCNGIDGLYVKRDKDGNIISFGQLHKFRCHLTHLRNRPLHP